IRPWSHYSTFDRTRYRLVMTNRFLFANSLLTGTVLAGLKTQNSRIGHRINSSFLSVVLYTYFYLFIYFLYRITVYQCLHYPPAPLTPPRHGSRSAMRAPPRLL